MHRLARHAPIWPSFGNEPDALSPRGARSLELVVDGMLNKQAGRQLGVTEKTIKATAPRS